MKKQVFTLLLIVFFLTGSLFLFAEGKQEKAAEKAEDGVVTLNMVLGEWAPEPLKPFFEEYEKVNNVNIEYEAYPFRELFETIQIRQEAQSKDIDVFFVDAPLVPSYAVRGYMADLSNYFTDKEVEDTWAYGSGDAGYWEGKFYAPPLNNSSQVMYYNKDLLDQAGVDYPSVDIEDRWTWSDVVAAAQKVKALGEGTWGFAFDQINRYYQLQVLPESLGGGSGVTKDGLTVDITNDGWVEAFTWYGKLYNDWQISPKGASPAEVPELFGAGKIGFFVGGLWNIPAFNDSGVNYAVAPHPYFQKGKPATPTLSWHVGVWSHTQKEKEAADFVRYLTTDPAIGKHWLQEHGQFPARKKVLEFIRQEEKYAEQPYIGYRIGAYEVTNTAVLRARTPGFLEFEEVTSNMFEDIRNAANVKQTLMETQDRLNRMMKKYQ